MALPIMLVLFGAVAQVLITAQSRVHLEQAAYAAARAALVHKCPPFDLLERLATSPAGLLPGECDTRRAELDRIALQKATDAARWALVAAAPTSGSAAGRGCDTVPAAEDILIGGDRILGRSQAAINALCYVFEPGNVTVDIEWVRPAGFGFATSNEHPIRATVEFRFPLSTPFRRFVYDGKRGDGTYWKSGSASVLLL